MRSGDLVMGATMDFTTALLGFAAAAALVTVTPGLDTALVLRTATVEGAKRALMASFGIVTGLMVWGLAVALGLGALIAVSELAYRVVQVAGAIYLIWLGGQMLWAARKPAAVKARRIDRVPNWFLRGFLTNLLNPKIGVFYVSFLPQFVPAGAPVAGFTMLLAAMHVGMSLLWFGGLTLATRPFARALQGPVVPRILDAATGTVLIGLAAKLLLEKRA
ncbi:threonine/homoserine/homoserine lactone efflux protein [Primorskyibacter sedentarius]|uniref:Threonine/homoserine/homoserine lactone efflux protein n=3 Tax=Primorskyibacter sedentarius TaxID=745311 RepID=A0A4R3JMY3_9RHOB|nr:threonine/homoserine/homoserine lactone efflux protein [Primorskyibacter sedentarius]